MKGVYLDCGAAASTHPQVMEAMIPYLGEFFGNPQSLHDWGQEAQDGVVAWTCYHEWCWLRC